MSKVAIQGNASGTGTFTIAAPDSDENRTLTLPDEAGTVLTSASDVLTSASDLTGLTGVPTGNTPYFFAYKTSGGSASQALTSASSNLITLDGSVVSDSGSWASNKFTVPSGKGGYYYISAQVSVFIDANALKALVPKIYRNGSMISGTYGVVVSSNQTIRHYTSTTQCIVSLSAGDEIELYAYVDDFSGTVNATQGDTQGSAMTNITGWRISE